MRACRGRQRRRPGGAPTLCRPGNSLCTCRAPRMFDAARNQTPTDAAYQPRNRRCRVTEGLSIDPTREPDAALEVVEWLKERWRSLSSAEQRGSAQNKFAKESSSLPPATVEHHSRAHLSSAAKLDKRVQIPRQTPKSCKAQRPDALAQARCSDSSAHRTENSPSISTCSLSDRQRAAHCSPARHAGLVIQWRSDRRDMALRLPRLSCVKSPHCMSMSRVTMRHTAATPSSRRDPTLKPCRQRRRYDLRDPGAPTSLSSPLSPRADESPPLFALGAPALHRESPGCPPALEKTEPPMDTPDVIDDGEPAEARCPPPPAPPRSRESTEEPLLPSNPRPSAPPAGPAPLISADRRCLASPAFTRPSAPVLPLPARCQLPVVPKWRPAGADLWVPGDGTACDDPDHDAPDSPAQ